MPLLVAVLVVVHVPVLLLLLLLLLLLMFVAVLLLLTLLAPLTWLLPGSAHEQGHPVPGSGSLQYMDADFEEWTRLGDADELGEALSQPVFQLRCA